MTSERPPSTSLDAARRLMSLGFRVVPVPPRQKACVVPMWPALRLEDDDLPKHFACSDANVGVLMGAASGGRVDIDLDHPDAVVLADEYLPTTEMSWGRDSKPRSHRIYVSAMVSAQFQAGKPGGVDEDGRPFAAQTVMLVEIRSDRRQTLAPGSVHPSGERVEFAECGEAAHVDRQSLLAQVRALAEATFERAGLAAQGWQRGWVVHTPPRPQLNAHTSSGPAPIDRVLNALRSKGIEPRTTTSGWTCRCPAHDDQDPSLSIGVGTDQQVLLHCHAGCGLDAVLSALGVRLSELFPTGSDRPRHNGASEPSRHVNEASSDHSSGPSTSTSNESWPLPRSLPPALPAVLPFDLKMLPGSLRDSIGDISDRVQCPPEFVAVPAMVALSMLVGRQVGIRPKAKDDWTVVPNLWGAIIGRPGVMKTPAIADALRPLHHFEATAKREFDEATREAEAQAMVDDARRKDSAQKIKKNLQNPGEAKRIAMESLSEDDGQGPTRARYVVNDSTVEKLGELLNQNPRGLLVFRDELIGLLKGLDKDGQEGARSFYLEAWNGTGRFAYDRIGRGTLDIEAAIVSIVGGIQPGPLAQYLRGAQMGGAGDDGLVQRFQLLVWPDADPEWRNVDRHPNREARDKAWAVYKGLDKIDPELVLAERDSSDASSIPFLRFDEAAQRIFDPWREKLEVLLRSGQLSPSLESHLAKYRSLIPSLALLIHLAEGQRGPVSASALTRAIQWGVYLRSHAERVYAHAGAPERLSGRALASKIFEGKLTQQFRVREVYRLGWSTLSTAQEVEAAAELLVDLDWLKPVQLQTGGRPTTVYLINPHVAERKSLDVAPPGTDETDERSVGGAFVGSGGSPGRAIHEILCGMGGGGI